MAAAMAAARDALGDAADGRLTGRVGAGILTMEDCSVAYLCLGARLSLASHSDGKTE